MLAVYAAGFARTRSAADQLDAQSAERRPAAPEGRGAAPSNAEQAQSTPGGRADAPSTAAHVTPDPISDERSSAPQVARLEPAPTLSGSNPSREPATSPAEEQKTAVVAPTVVAPTMAAPTPAAVAPAPAIPTPVPVAASVAPAPPAPQQPAPAPAAPKWKDGTYTGWGTSRHGDIQAAVVIEGGRIMAATIAQCLTRYSCNVIGRIPPEVAQRQSPEVDYVSGATQSVNAFYYAVVEALGKAK